MIGRWSLGIRVFVSKKTSANFVMEAMKRTKNSGTEYRFQIGGPGHRYWAASASYEVNNRIPLARKHTKYR
jgi:hypothetical protein